MELFCVAIGAGSSNLSLACQIHEQSARGALFLDRQVDSAHPAAQWMRTSGGGFRTISSPTRGGLICWCAACSRAVTKARRLLPPGSAAPQERPALRVEAGGETGLRMSAENARSCSSISTTIRRGLAPRCSQSQRRRGGKAITWRATRAQHFAQQSDPHFKPFFTTRRDFGGAGMPASASLALSA